MVVVQWVERSLLTPEISSSNSVIGKLLYRTFVSVNCIEKTKLKKDRELPVFKDNFHHRHTGLDLLWRQKGLVLSGSNRIAKMLAKLEQTKI